MGASPQKKNLQRKPSLITKQAYKLADIGTLPGEICSSSPPKIESKRSIALPFLNISLSNFT